MFHSFLLIIITTSCLSLSVKAFRTIPSFKLYRFNLSSSASSSARNEIRKAFLIDKNIINTKKSNQMIQLKCILDPKSADDEEDTLHYRQCQRRLDRIIDVENDEVLDYIPDDVQAFEDFIAKHPSWGDPNSSYVFWRDYQKSPNPIQLRQRAQLSGLCYFHGPDILQHYLVSMNSNGKGGMINMLKFIREVFSSQELYKHIFDAEGGDSVKTLERILQPNTYLVNSKPSDYASDIKQYGPGLVSRFRVYKDFSLDASPLVCSHLDEVDRSNEEHLGLHAMVLVGHRKDTEGKDIFLLQNWWKKKQFVEVSSSYLTKSKAIVFFVETPQLSIPPEFPVEDAVYAEAMSFVDKPESIFLGEYHCAY